MASLEISTDPNVRRMREMLQELVRDHKTFAALVQASVMFASNLTRVREKDLDHLISLQLYGRYQISPATQFCRQMRYYVHPVLTQVRNADGSVAYEQRGVLLKDGKKKHMCQPRRPDQT